MAWSELAARSLDAPTPAWRAVRRLNTYSNRLPSVRRAVLRTMAGLRNARSPRAPRASGHCWSALSLKELVEAGKVTPVIDRRYELSEVPEALRYQGEGHAQGKIVIAV